MGTQDRSSKKSAAGNRREVEYENIDKNGIKITKDATIDKQLSNKRQRKYNKMHEE